MAYKLSTALRNYMVGTGSFKQAMDGGKIRIFVGDEPASADAAEAGQLLVEIGTSGGAGGFSFDASSLADGTIFADMTLPLSGTNVASGRAGYFRHVAPGDDGSASITQCRTQGRISTSGAEGNLKEANLLVGEAQAIDSYSFQLPTY